MPNTKNLSEQDAVEVSLYTALDAARYLRVPVWVVLSVFDPLPHHMMGLYERFLFELPFTARFADDYGPIFPEKEDRRISFQSLAALFVLTAVFRPLLPESPFPWRHSKDFFYLFEQTHQVVRKMVDDPRLFTDPELVLNRYGHINDRTPDIILAHLLKLVALHQSRVELKDGVPVRLFPFSRDPVSDAPNVVVIDPEIRFGRPTVKGVPTDVLVERWRAGDNSADLAEDYGLTTDEVDEALRYEATPYLAAFLSPFTLFGW